MSPEIIFLLHLILGYVAWLLCFGVYILPKLKSMGRVDAHRVVAAAGIHQERGDRSGSRYFRS